MTQESFDTAAGAHLTVRLRCLSIRLPPYCCSERGDRYTANIRIATNRLKTKVLRKPYD